MDGHGTIVFANDQAETRFGWTPAELVGKSIETLVPEDVVHRHVEHRDRYMAEPQARPMGANLQLSARRKDGSTFPAEISLNAVTSAPGERLVLAAVRDVTDRMELEAVRQREALAEQREQVHRLESLGQLAGGVAHDFNNLLGVIMNYTALLARGITDPLAMRDLDEIRAAAERGAGLTRQLLTFARRDVVHPEPLEVNSVVEALAMMLGRTLGDHIDLHLQLSADRLVVLADRHQLEQILLNLAINARDAMRDGGVLTIGTSSAGAEVLLTVGDTGHGMPPEVAARAFEPFFTTKSTGEGTGLGLATVYGIVQQGRGTVAIESAPGAGTTVVVRLPAASGATLEADRSRHMPAGGRERILLVEDEPALRAGTARMLADRGYTVLVATDGVDALELLADEVLGVDLVVTDVAMPKMRGDELARVLAVRAPQVPVIFVSGYDSGDDPLPGRVLPKPLSEDVLLRAVREVLDA